MSVFLQVLTSPPPPTYHPRNGRCFDADPLSPVSPLTSDSLSPCHRGGCHPQYPDMKRPLSAKGGRRQSGLAPRTSPGTPPGVLQVIKPACARHPTLGFFVIDPDVLLRT
ncbi:hypothetical protein J6590_027088 [Homalodisca vitripennis]|nr:hypothetical protein J6590_027088 [Homalodisca vitripennis]